MDAMCKSRTGVDTFARDHLHHPHETPPDLIFALPKPRYPRRLDCVMHFIGIGLIATT